MFLIKKRLIYKCTFFLFYGIWQIFMAHLVNIGGFLAYVDLQNLMRDMETVESVEEMIFDGLRGFGKYSCFSFLHPNVGFPRN